MIKYLRCLLLIVISTWLIAGSACWARPDVSQSRESVTVFDMDGTRIQVAQPVEKVISVNSGMTALICALGKCDRIVGRDAFSTFPSYAREEIEVVAENSANCNLELIISKTPDLVVADTMFYPQNREKLDAAGIPSFVDTTSNPDRLLILIRSVGLALDADERAEDLARYLDEKISIVDQRIARLDVEEGARPKVYFEWLSAMKSTNAETSFHKAIVQAGGVNIAAGQPVRTPEMSSEWVIQQNPDVIINRISGDATLKEMQDKYTEIINRPGWENVSAVKNNRVYIIKADVFLTIRYPVGLYYYATWFHPELFPDIDPEAVHQEIIETFFGKDEWEMLSSHEAFVYPAMSE